MEKILTNIALSIYLNFSVANYKSNEYNYKLNIFIPKDNN